LLPTRPRCGMWIAPCEEVLRETPNAGTAKTER
jgi:hypothetical protein